ncbi:hypothetical protein DMC47_23745 [Nostoc sp. 3335mG]|jgi:hypothetical protein|nr:hypothetical protein DMC47_23745 [Nostoc sp. 3335mG]
MDDGGLGINHAIEWSDEGVSRLDAVLAGDIMTEEWDREDWGSQFTRQITTIYSMHIEGCSQRVETASFRNILSTWREFIAAGPKVGASINIDV